MRILLLAAALCITACTAPVAQPLQPSMNNKDCGAAALQSFVGKPKEKLPVNLPKATRIMCDTCAATMDYSPARLNVIFDSNTGVVTKIKCG